MAWRNAEAATQLQRSKTSSHSHRRHSAVRPAPVAPRGRNVCHFGLARPGHAPGAARAGEVAAKVMSSGKGNYLANLILYPG
jgi:hypothetical protein